MGGRCGQLLRADDVVRGLLSRDGLSMGGKPGQVVIKSE